MTEKPPVTKTTHPLPFKRLSPLDFEHLCLWLVRREGYEKAEHFGVKGSDQRRDVVAWRDERRVVFQCKKVERFGRMRGSRGESSKALRRQRPMSEPAESYANRGRRMFSV